MKENKVGSAHAHSDPANQYAGLRHNRMHAFNNNFRFNISPGSKYFWRLFGTCYKARGPKKNMRK